MDGGDRTFAPEWYKSSSSSGNLSGSSDNHDGSTSNPDNRGGRPSSRNRLLMNGYDRDTPRPSRTSSFGRNVSTNGYSARERSSNSRSYSNFGRNQIGRDKICDFHDQGRLYLLEKKLSVSNSERDLMKRSNSLSSERRIELDKRPRRNSRNSAPVNTNSTSMPSFDRDFPSLGNIERKQEVPRVSSPRLTSAMANISKITSTTIGVEGWISALAEAPVKVGSSGPVSTSMSQTSSETSLSTVSSTGLSMAETLAQAPVGNNTVSQMSVDAKKHEEFSLCSKLIPVTKTLNKNSALEKTKLKGVRTSGLSGATKVGLSGQPFHTSTKTDNLKSPQGGNFQILTRDINGIIPSKEDSSNSNQCVLPVGVPAAIVSPPKIAEGMKLKLDKEQAKGSLVQSPYVEKRNSSQSKNRNDFFNTIRKKALMEKSVKQDVMDFSASVDHDKGSRVTDAASEYSLDNVTELSKVFHEHISSNHVGNCNFENNCPILISVDGSINSIDILNSWSKNDEETSLKNVVIHSSKGSSDSLPLLPTDDASWMEHVVAPSEKELALLHELGWDENADGDVITPEEIEDFMRQHPERMPSLKLGRI